MKPGISYNNNYKKTDNKDIYTITFTGPAYNKQNFYDDLIHKCICFGFELKTEYVIDQNYYKSIK